MHIMAQSTISIMLALCKINTNNDSFEGSHLTLLYLMGSFLIGYIEVRYSLLFYLVLLVISKILMLNSNLQTLCYASFMLETDNCLRFQLTNIYH